MTLSEIAISRRRLAMILGLLAMIGPFAIDSIFPAFRVLAQHLSVPDAAIQQTISIYLLGYALMSLLHGALSDAFGRKPIIIIGLCLFLVSSIGCAFAHDLPGLLFFRFTQGLSAGVGLIVGRAVIRDVFDGSAAQKMMSLVSMIFSIAPAIAPIIGGYILAWSHWQGIFWFLAALSGFMLLIVALFLPESHRAQNRVAFHPVHLSIAYWSMLKDRSFRLLALTSSLLFAALFMYIAAAPDFVLLHLGLNEQQFGYFFVPTIAGMSIGAFISGKVAGRIPAHKLVQLGFMVCVISALANLGYSSYAEHLRLPWAVMPLSGFAFGIALVFPIVTIALLDLYPHIRGTASSMQAFIGLMANAIVSGVFAPLLSKNPQHMAAAALVLVICSYLLWRYYVQHSKKLLLGTAQTMAYEPTNEL